MAIGALDVNGVWQYGEDDSASPASDLLNLGMESVSDAVGDAKARLTTLEAPPAAPTGVVYSAGWADYWGGFSPVTWSKDKDGWIRLSGMFKRTGATITEAGSGVIFTLPVGARPAGTEMFISNKGNTTAFAEILSTGVVWVSYPYTWTSGSTWMYVPGVMFKAA